MIKPLFYALLLQIYFIPHTVFSQYENSLPFPISNNRIQYSKSPNVIKYNTPNAIFYCPKNYDSLLKFTIQVFSTNRNIMEQKTGLKYKTTPKVIIYPSLKGFVETNIGSNINITQEMPSILSDNSNRIVLTFQGNYEAFYDEIKIAQLKKLWIDNKIIASDNNNSQLNLNWFLEGLTKYISEGFTLKDNDSLFSILSKNTIINIEDLFQNKNQLLISKGFCWFLEEHYKKDNIFKIILFHLTKNKNFETSLRIVTKRDMEELTYLYAMFLKNVYPLSDEYFQNLDLKKKNNQIFNNEDTIIMDDITSSFKILKIQTKHKTRIYLKEGIKLKKIKTITFPNWISANTKLNIPLVEIHDNNFYIISLNKGRLIVDVFNNYGTKVKSFFLPDIIEGVTDFKIIDKNRWLISAYTKGRGDIIEFIPNTLKIKALTNDIIDQSDLQIDTLFSNKILFRSGYPNFNNVNSNINNYGLYELDISNSNSTRLITQDSINFNKKINQFYLNPNNISLHEKYWIRSYINHQNKVKKQIVTKEPDSSFLFGMLNRVSSKTKSNTVNYDTFNDKNIIPNSFTLNNVWFKTGISNEFFSNRIQPYYSQMGIYKIPELGGMIQGVYSDIYEHNNLELGYRIPAATQGSEFFFYYFNKSKRIDWFCLFNRKVEHLRLNPKNPWFNASGQPYPLNAKLKNSFLGFGLNYPLNYFSKFTAKTIINRSKTVFLASEKYSLTFPPIKENWNFTSFSYSYDNSQFLNKFFVGLSLKTSLDLVGLLGENINQKFSYSLKQNIYYSLNIKDWANWSNNINLGYSGGSEYFLYNFGGMDNNVIQRIDSNIVFNQKDPYLVQELISPLRGFKQNTMFGNSYCLWNTELFVQLFGGILPYQTQFKFINLMQVGVFSDFAVSRITWNPYQYPIIRNSFGCSVRTILANYPIRMDLAFPYNFSNKPMIHLTLKL